MNLVLPSYSFEALTPNFMFRGTFQPRGEIMTFTNDARYIYHTFDDVEMYPVEQGYQINCIKQRVINVNREQIIFISLQNKEDAQKVQVLAAKRPIVFYTDSFAIHGNLHANADFNDNDLIGEARDFVAISDAKIFPLKQTSCPLTMKVPILVLNRHQALGYHVYTPNK